MATRLQALQITGTGENRHAYWFLREAIDTDRVESINRGVASALGGDQRSADATRILRPAGSLNRKRRFPVVVRLLHLDLRSRVDANELQGANASRPPGASAPTQTPDPRWAVSDRLRVISPWVYVARLTGQRVRRSGKIRCPFHDDRAPSLHVYEDPERGWYCYGCGRGGSIYDLAALLWERGTRGQDFLELRRDLEEFLS